MTGRASLDTLVNAAASLEIRPRENRWTHLSLCVLDAVFSIGVRYAGVVRVCHRYAQHANLADPLLPVSDLSRVVGTRDEQLVDRLASHGRSLGAEHFAADVCRNRGRTSTCGGILKAEAAIRYAEILASAGIHTLADVTTLTTDVERQTAVETQLRQVPGNGAGDIRLNYLWMLAGDDHLVKPDRMILRWLRSQLGVPVDPTTARTLIADLAARLGRTPWEIDHAIWRSQSGRTPLAYSGAAGAVPVGKSEFKNR